MKSYRIFITVIIALLTILCLCQQATAAGPDTPLQKQIKVQFESTDQLNQLRGMGLDIWKIYADHLVAAVDYEKVAQIEGLGFSVEVMSDDAWGVLKPEPQIDGLDKTTASAGEFDDYHTNDEAYALLMSMEASGVGKVYDIGDSVEGRDIWAIRISDNPTVDEDDIEPSILLVGCHHAREWITVEVSLYIAKYLTDNYATDPEIASLVDRQQIWIVPVLNPDGYAYSYPNNPDWRKNRRDNGDGTYGIDLNRNYDYEWGLDIGSSGNTGDSTYRGPYAFSEPETRALRDLFLAHPFRSMITYHNYGGMVAYLPGVSRSTIRPIVAVTATSPTS
jgi:murein tripeptide amidase MpaA